MNEKLEYEIARFSGRISLDKVKKQPFGVLDECVHELQHALRLCGIEKEIKL